MCAKLVRVLFDLDYRVNGDRLNIKANEQLVLLSQENADWWLVRRPSSVQNENNKLIKSYQINNNNHRKNSNESNTNNNDTNNNEFYVPSSYIVVQTDETPNGTKKDKNANNNNNNANTTKQHNRQDENIVNTDEAIGSSRDTLDEFEFDSDDYDIPEENCNLDQQQEKQQQFASNNCDNMKPNSNGNDNGGGDDIESIYAEPVLVVKPMPRTTRTTTTTRQHEYANLSPRMSSKHGSIKHNISSKSLPSPAAPPPPPVPRENPPSINDSSVQLSRVLFDGWTEYTDSKGRKFYHNTTTKANTWKPPRRMTNNELDTSNVILTFDDNNENNDSNDNNNNNDNDNDGNGNGDDDSNWPPPPTPPPPPTVVRKVTLTSTSTSTPKPSMTEQSTQTDPIPMISSMLKLQQIIAQRAEMQRLDGNGNGNGTTTTTNTTTATNNWFNKPEFYAELSAELEAAAAAAAAASADNGTRGQQQHQLHDINNATVDNTSICSPPLPPPQYTGRKLSEKAMQTNLDRSIKAHSVALFSNRAGKHEIVLKEEFKHTTSFDAGQIMIPPPPIKIDDAEIIHCSPLNRSRTVIEKKVSKRKHWASSFVVLTKYYLLFYKEKNASSPNAKPEFVFGLLNASIEKCSSKTSSRKNCFQVSTFQDQVLLQHDNEQSSNQWFSAISNCIDKLPQTPLKFDSAVPGLVGSGAGGGSPEGKMKLKRSRSTKAKPGEESDGGGGLVMMQNRNHTLGGYSSTTFNNNNKSSGGGGNHSPVVSSDKKGKIRERLLQFLRVRPSMESLREKGIIKDEHVFCCNLDTLCAREQTVIPKFVRHCIETIETRGLQADGIYRACGNMSTVQKLRFEVNQDKYEGLRKEEDVHVLTGLLKLFFRQMPEPLFPCDRFMTLMQYYSIPNRQQKIESFRHLVHELPSYNYNTLKYLLEHLIRVTKQSQENRMSVQNLAIVFGPTLIRPQSDSNNLLMDMMLQMQQSQVIEFLLLEYETIFK